MCGAICIILGMPNGAPRIHGFRYQGPYRYSLTFCAHSRQVVFDNAELVAGVLTEIQKAAETERFQVLTYCFMPDHLHLLVEGTTDNADLQRFIKTWKQLAQAIGQYPYAGCCVGWVE